MLELTLFLRVDEWIFLFQGGARGRSWMRIAVRE
jgi:hypothetical protein